MRGAMIFTMGLVWTSAAAAQVAPAPVIARVAPPIVSTGSYAVPMAAERRAMPVTPITVRMTLGNQLLWSGPLNIGGSAQARISLVEPVADANVCDRMGEGRLSRQIELSINAQSYRSSNGSDYRLSARYSRPSDGGGCPSGTRSISIDQSFSLDGRKTLVFEGDGGLKLHITVP